MHELCCKFSSIELEMYKQYVDKLRAKRAPNFEIRNVQNLMKLWYARNVCRKLTSIELEMHTQYEYIDELRAKARCKYWS